MDLLDKFQSFKTQIPKPKILTSHVPWSQVQESYSIKEENQLNYTNVIDLNVQENPEPLENEIFHDNKNVEMNEKGNILTKYI